MEGARFLTLRIIFWRKQNGTSKHCPYGGKDRAPRDCRVHYRPGGRAAFAAGKRLPAGNWRRAPNGGEAKAALCCHPGKEDHILCRRTGGAVGMCSVSRCWSTFSCGWTAALEDFYVEPAFRKKGIARLLAGAAQRWCAEQGIASLTVCCAPCDEGMYRALGFSEPLGRTLACLP